MMMMMIMMMMTMIIIIIMLMMALLMMMTMMTMMLMMMIMMIRRVPKRCAKARSKVRTLPNVSLQAFQVCEGGAHNWTKYLDIRQISYDFMTLEVNS